MRRYAALAALLLVLSACGAGVKPSGETPEDSTPAESALSDQESALSEPGPEPEEEESPWPDWMLYTDYPMDFPTETAEEETGTAEGAPENKTVPLTLINNTGRDISTYVSEVEVEYTGNLSYWLEFQYTVEGEEEPRRGWLDYAAQDGGFFSGRHAATAMTLTFTQEGETLTVTSCMDDGGMEAVHIYSELFQDWAMVAPGGIAIFQDLQLDYDEWQQAQQSGEEWHATWEPYYPGEVTDWLRSPVESRGFVVPQSTIYNVDVWHAEYTSHGPDTLELQHMLHFDQVTPQQVLTLKTVGDINQNILTWQDGAGSWYFMPHGFSGARGGLYCTVYTRPNRSYVSKWVLPWDPAPVGLPGYEQHIEALREHFPELLPGLNESYYSANVLRRPEEEWEIRAVWADKLATEKGEVDVVLLGVDNFEWILGVGVPGEMSFQYLYATFCPQKDIFLADVTGDSAPEVVVNLGWRQGRYNTRYLNAVYRWKGGELEPLYYSTGTHGENTNTVDTGFMALTSPGNQCVVYNNITMEKLRMEMSQYSYRQDMNTFSQGIFDEWRMYHIGTNSGVPPRDYNRFVLFQPVDVDGDGVYELMTAEFMTISYTSSNTLGVALCVLRYNDATRGFVVDRTGFMPFYGGIGDESPEWQAYAAAWYLEELAVVAAR